MFFGYHQKMCRCLRGNVKESKTLVILINDFGWDFLANDLPEDRVAARPGDLSLGDLICHLCLPPVRPAGEKVGRREEPGARAEGGSERTSLRRDLNSLLRAPLLKRFFLSFFFFSHLLSCFVLSFISGLLF